MFDEFLPQIARSIYMFGLMTYTCLFLAIMAGFPFWSLKWWPQYESLRSDRKIYSSTLDKHFLRYFLHFLVLYFTLSYGALAILGTEYPRQLVGVVMILVTTISMMLAVILAPLILRTKWWEHNPFAKT